MSVKDDTCRHDAPMQHRRVTRIALLTLPQCINHIGLASCMTEALASYSAGLHSCIMTTKGIMLSSTMINHTLLGKYTGKLRSSAQEGWRIIGMVHQRFMTILHDNVGNIHGRSASCFNVIIKDGIQRNGRVFYFLIDQ